MSAADGKNKREFVCPYCDHMFVVGLLKYTTAKRTENGKLLTCPRCGKTNAFRD